MMKRFFLKLHLYLGFSLGLLLSVLCLTGAILVFKNDISELLEPEVYRTERPAPEAKPMPLDELVRSVEAHQPNIELSSLVVPHDLECNLQLHLKDDKRTILYIDRYTAEVKGVKTRQGFFFDVMRLHRWLLGSKGSAGQYIVAYSTLGFILIVISGLILWIPRNRRQLRAAWRIKFTASRQRLYRDLHITLGAYLTLPIVVLAITGLFFSPIKWVGSTINSLAGSPAKVESDKPSSPAVSPDQQPQLRAHWDAIVDELQRREPQAASITLEPTKAKTSLYKGWGNMRASNEYTIDPESGSLMLAKLYAEQPAYTKVRGWIYTIHIGAWGGWLSKLLTCLVAVLAGSLPLTGYYLYIKKRRALGRGRQK